MYRKEIVYDRETRDYAMYLDGELVGFAGLAGCLYSYSEQYISPNTYNFELTILFLLAIIMGGRNYANHVTELRQTDPREPWAVRTPGAFAARAGSRRTPHGRPVRRARRRGPR